MGKTYQSASFQKSALRLMKTTCITLTILTCFCNDAIALNADEQRPTSHIWQLPNGEVELSDPLTSFSRYKLANPILLGSGGGGAVFSTHSLDGQNKDIAVKISWVRSASSVERECRILKELEHKNTRNVETCVGVERYPQDTQRAVIALEPVVDNAVARVDKINQDVQVLAVQSIVRTLIDMLGANVVTTDVQALMDRESGSVLFIDMTEAQIMSNPPSFLDFALASSFCAEIVSLIPETLTDVASKTFFDELSAAHSQGVYFPISIYEMLQNQSILLNSGSIELIESTITSMK